MAGLLKPGYMVRFKGSIGIACVAEVSGTRVRVEYFDSPAIDRVGSQWVEPDSGIGHCRLSPGTHIFFIDDEGFWRTGQIRTDGDRDSEGFVPYLVRVPHLDRDVVISEKALRVRWEKPIHDPLGLLLASGQSSPTFRDARLPVRASFIAQRGACASATSVLSSAVQLHSHQVNAAVKILQDPVQRYLLADEVGMGKTIQAGYVIRQVLLDKGDASILVLVPRHLTGQWRTELESKFFISDFPDANVRVLKHEDCGNYDPASPPDLLVVDEAHEFFDRSSRANKRYEELKLLSSEVSRLILISATPAMQRDEAHLALLNLLDPQIYRVEELDRFRHLLEVRRSLAYAIFALDPEPDLRNKPLFEFQVSKLLELLPADEHLVHLRNRALEVFQLPDEPSTRSALVDAVSEIRSHVSETYRLHRRVIRHRRHRVLGAPLDVEGLCAPFEVTGRQRPVAMPSPEVISASLTALSEWTSGVVAAVQLDQDPVAAGRTLAVLVAAAGGSSQDITELLRWRLRYRPQPPIGWSTQDLTDLDALPPQPFEPALVAELMSVQVRAELAALADMVIKVAKGSRWTVVFTGKGTLGSELSALLSTRSKSVYRHLRMTPSDELDRAVTAWTKVGGLLVCDESGEVGANLQVADLAIHLRVSTDANSFEQRIGRVDRYGRTGPAKQIVLTSQDKEAIHRSWMTLLVRGFGLFDASISGLQDSVDRLMPEVWSRAAQSGPDSLRDACETVAEVLRSEFARVNELDELDSFFEDSVGGRDLATEISAYETNAAAVLEEQHLRLLGDDSGYRLEVRKLADGVLRFTRGREAPVLSARLMRFVEVPGKCREGSFDRAKALQHPGRRLFRLGNPFIDGVLDLVDLDDRGVASSVWRVDRGWDEEDLLYLGFDFSVQADLQPLLDAVGDDVELSPTLRRRCDSALKPFSLRVWVNAASRQAVVAPTDLALLNRPFSVVAGDEQLDPAKMQEFANSVGGQLALTEVARSLQDVAEEHLRKVTELTSQCEEARLTAHARSVVTRAQAEARARSAGLVMDLSGLEQDHRLDVALEASVARPEIVLIGASLVVRSAVAWSERADG